MAIRANSKMTRIVIYLRGILSISRVWKCLRNAAMFYRGKLRTYLNVFFCLLYVVHVFSCLKSSILVIFEFARIAISVPFCLFLGTKRRSQCVFAMSRCAIKSHLRTEFNVSCLLCILRVLSCSKGSFKHQFLNVSWIIIYACFVYFLGRNGALNMFAQCNDMPTGLT